MRNAIPLVLAVVLSSAGQVWWVDKTPPEALVVLTRETRARQAGMWLEWWVERNPGELGEWLAWVVKEHPHEAAKHLLPLLAEAQPAIKAGQVDPMIARAIEHAQAALRQPLTRK